MKLFIFAMALFTSLSSTEPIATEKCEGELKNNIKQGFWKCFYSDGTLQQEGNYQDGKKQDTWKLYHANGILAGEGNYINDLEKGKWKFYDDSGKVILEQEY